MNEQICLVAAIGGTGSWDARLEERGHWHQASTNHCLSSVSALVRSRFSLKVLTSCPSSSTLVQKIRQLSPDHLVTGFQFSNSKALASSLDGSAGVILITDTDYEKEDPVTDEVVIGRQVAEACLTSGIPHAIFFTKMHIHASIGLRSDACDAKAHIADYMDEKNLRRTFLVTPLLYEDFLCGVLKPRKTNKSNILEIAAPMGYIPLDMISLDDIGSCVKSVLENPNSWIGKTVALSGDKMTVEEYAQIMTDQVYPHLIKVAEVTPDDFMEINQWPGSEDFANYCDYLTRDLQRKNNETTLSLCKNAECFYDWTKKRKTEIKSMCM